MNKNIRENLHITIPFDLKNGKINLKCALYNIISAINNGKLISYTTSDVEINLLKEVMAECHAEMIREDCPLAYKIKDVLICYNIYTGKMEINKNID